jgi:hypothetical protein
MKKRFFLSAMIFIKSLSGTTPADKDPWVTIFIHGSMGDTICVKHLIKLFKNDITGSAYKRQTIKRRNEAAWWRYQPAQAVGLRKIHIEKKVQTAAQLFALLYDEMQQTFFPEQQTIGYYTYGWSGLINHQERVRTGRLLYQELKALIEDLKKTEPRLKVRVIGYSHGANVVLNMSYAHDIDPTPPDFVINEFIMVGAPIQRQTDCQIVSPFFETVYNIYSRSDCVQRLDIFSGVKTLASRKFYSNRCCSVPDKIYQTEVKLTISADKDIKQKNCSKKRINRSPGHIELWHFQELCDCDGDGIFEPCFESSLYRRHFPLHPVPMAIFIPGIIKNTWYHETIFEMQPDRGKAIIRQRYCREKKAIDFLSENTIKSIRDRATPGRKKELS